MNISFKTIVVILLSLILVYTMMTKKIDDPELLDWSVIGRLNLDSMSNLLNSDPIIINKKNNGYAFWDSVQKQCILKKYDFINRIEIKDNNTFMNANPWIYVYCKFPLKKSVKLSEKDHVLSYSEISDLKKLLKNHPNNI